MLPTKVITQVLLAFLVGLFLAGGIWIYRKGAENALINIERQNNAAGNASDAARRAYTRCADRGWMFDYATSKCSRTETGNRN